MKFNKVNEMYGVGPVRPISNTFGERKRPTRTIKKKSHGFKCKECGVINDVTFADFMDNKPTCISCNKPLK